MKPSKIKLTPIQTIELWNLLSDLHELSKAPEFTGWTKRIMAYMRPEVKIWNSLSIEERRPIVENELQYPVEKINACFLPDVISQEQARVLEPVVDGEIQIYRSQLEQQIMNQSRKNGTPEEASANKN